MKWFKHRQSNQSINPFGIEKDVFKNYNLDKEDREHEINEAIITETKETRSSEYISKTVKKKTLRNLLVITILVFGIFMGRAAQLQVIEGGNYRVLAEGNRIRIEVISPMRGVVYDRNGSTLVDNVSTFTVAITAADLPEDEHERSLVIQTIAEATGQNPLDIENLLSEYSSVPLEPIPVARDMDYEAALRMATSNHFLRGVKIYLNTKRDYATDRALSLSHLLGYMGKINAEEIDQYLEQGYRRSEEIGRQGIEKTYEAFLRGIPGRKIVEVDALGQEVTVLTHEEAQNGYNIRLSIDADLQEYIEDRLIEYQKTSNSRKASVVVIDPNNGEVLSMVSLPSFDSNDFSGGIDTENYSALINDDNQPLFFRAISGEYPSGSTFKPIVASAALEEGIIDERTSFLSVGGVRITEWFFPDWRAGGHGITNVRKAIADSVNTFFYIVGGGHEDYDFIGLGVARITEYAAKFGLGSQTGIDLPGEATGFLPSKEWKEEVKGERWYIGDTYHLAIGQGDILVTPLQMALSTTVFANGGTLYEPRVIRSFWAEDGEVINPPSIVNDQVVSDNTIEIVRSGMRQTVTDGSARYMAGSSEKVAGKTGTAQVGGDAENHAWFTGFGPYESPEIAMAVLIENGGEGSSVAVPIARDIFTWWFDNR